MTTAQIIDRQPIVTDRLSALRWFDWLCRHDYDFHMDDDPADCHVVDRIDGVRENWLKTWDFYQSEYGSDGSRTLWDDYYETCTAHGKTSEDSPQAIARAAKRIDWLKTRLIKFA